MFSGERRARPAIGESGADLTATRGLPLWGLISLSAAPAVAYGLSRFAYALLLPPMKSDLNLSYTEAGSINTANNIGYLAGAILAFWIVRQANAKRAFLLGIFVTGLMLCATALFRDLNALLAIRVAAGVPAAVALVAGGILASHAGGNSKLGSALALNVYYCGGGLGIILSTAAALPILPEDGYGAWPVTWLLLGVITILSAVPALFAIRALSLPLSGANTKLTMKGIYGAGLVTVAAAYFFFGVGYIGYMTFVIAYLRDSAVGSHGIALFWILVGTAASAGAFAWTPVFSRLSAGTGMAAVMATIGVGALLPIVSPSLQVIVVSAVLFGSSFLSVVAAVNYAVRTQLPPERWAPAIAVMTVVVSIGQSIGPILAGGLSEASGLARGLMISPLCLFLGAGLAAVAGFAQRTLVQTHQTGSWARGQDHDRL